MDNMENCRKAFQKIKLEGSYDPAIPLLDIYPKAIKLVSERHLYHVHCSIVYNSQCIEIT